MLLIFLVIQVSLHAQQGKTIFLKSGQSSVDVLKFNDIYQYPVFKKGLVEFVNGLKANVLLNYNLLLGEMDFIDKKNDTLSLADAENLKWIIIENDTFYYNEIYIQSLASHGAVKVGKSQEWKVIRTDQLGAFGQKVLTSNINFEYLGERRHEKLTVKEDVNIALKSEFYISSKNKFQPLNKKNLLKQFPKSDKKISAFMNQENISLDNEADLIQLFDFIKSF